LSSSTDIELVRKTVLLAVPSGPWSTAVAFGTIGATLLSCANVHGAGKRTDTQILQSVNKRITDPYL